MDYKSTLNLPKTTFPMKADLPKKEPQFLDAWEELDIYSKLTRSKKPKYILHDGPPYANGDIHLGHVLNKTLKDIVIKYKSMRGFCAAYVPGWDCHGLPVEHQLFKELKINKYQIAQVSFRKKAHDYAMRYVSVQRQQFKRLGIFGDWENPYLTLSADYEESIIASLGKLVKQGYVYRGLKPVNWCMKCETALAEAEVEYSGHTSPSIFVKFRLDDAKDHERDSYLVIWTTTPWTLIANVAVCVHPDYIYSYVATCAGNLFIAKDLLTSVLSQAGIENYEVIKEVRGKDLEGLTYEHPLTPRKGKVLAADYVSKDEGSGLVHTAPGHGSEDYLTGIKYGLQILMPVDGRGHFDSSAGEFAGKPVFEANNDIVEKLEAGGALIHRSDFAHSYPHCWRCKMPVIFRATNQWFLKVDHKDLRKRMLSAIREKVKWFPASGRERISTMVELRPDWCLSRQRYWGVPIPVLACNKCGEEVLDPRVIERFRSLVAREGTDCWFRREASEFAPRTIKCPACKAGDFSKGSDILDVWFDSGVSHQAVLKKRRELEFPCDLYLEGSDQHRGWFQSSLIPSMCIDKKPPFKAVLTHGFVVDGQGRKMSKSMGNVILPKELIDDYGADLLRLWVASSDYNEDVRISATILSRLVESYRKIRNTVRFILSNLFDFDPDKHMAEYKSMRRIDRWAVARSEKLLERVTLAFEEFQFHRAFKGIYDFCNEELSMYYLDMVKGKLYTYAPCSPERRSAQTAIYKILGILVRLISPFLCFTAEEIWQSMPKQAKDSSVKSVHLLEWPKPSPKIAKESDPQLEEALALVPQVSKSLEEARSRKEIGSSFEAKIKLLTNDQKRYTYLTSLAEQLPEIFKVSQVEISKAGAGDLTIEVLKAKGKKCPRCWNYSTRLGSDMEHPDICDSCLKVIKER
ncbi:isoleucine--tRNA ligase [Candidatus Omnitrophota bacterium]